MRSLPRSMDPQVRPALLSHLAGAGFRMFNWVSPGMGGTVVFGGVFWLLKRFQVRVRMDCEIL